MFSTDSEEVFFFVGAISSDVEPIMSIQFSAKLTNYLIGIIGLNSRYSHSLSQFFE